MNKFLCLIIFFILSFNFFPSFADNSPQYDIWKSDKYGSIMQVVYSKNSKTMSFIAKKDSNDFNGGIIVRNGVEIKSLYNIWGLIYSPNGKSTVIEATKNGKAVIIKDGIEVNKYAENGQSFFSPDSKNFGFVASYKKGGKSFVVLNGKKISKEYENIGIIGYSPDGKSFSFLAIDNGKQFIVKDGVEGKKYQHILYPQYSPDSKSIIYIVGTEDENTNLKSFVARDGVQIGKLYGNIDSLTCLKNGDIFYRANPLDKNGNIDLINGSKYVLVKNGKEINMLYDKIIGPISFSNDGSSYAFTTRDDSNGKEFIVKDGIKITGYDSSVLPTYSPNGKNFSFFATRDGKTYAVKDGLEIEINNYGDGFGPDRIGYSPDGTRFYFTENLKYGNSTKSILTEYKLKK